MSKVENKSNVTVVVLNEVSFSIVDVKGACQELGYTYRSNLAAAKKQEVYTWLMDHKVAPIEPVAQKPVKEDKAPVKEETHEAIVKEIAHMEVILNEIVRYSSQNRYNNITDYRLYSNLKLKAVDCRNALNALYKEGMITVKSVRDYKVIAPTTKAIKATASNRPVSKEVCLKVFKAVTKYEYENVRFLNVTYSVLERNVGKSVGVVTLDNALNKLVEAGYVECKAVGSTVVYSSTKVGRDRLQSIA